MWRPSWHGRFVVECGLSLEDDALALAALSAVRFSPAAVEMLAELGTRYRVANIEGAMRRFRADSRLSKVEPEQPGGRR